MKLKSISVVIIFLIFCALFPNLCFADGTFIPPIKAKRKLPDIPIQRALLKYHFGVETLIIEATLDGEGDSFGWIIPVPNIPLRFEKVSPGLLKTLSLQTEPKIIHRRHPGIRTLLITFGVLFIIFFLRIIRAPKILYFVLFAVIAVMVMRNFLQYLSSSSVQLVGVTQVSRQVIGNYETFVLKATKVADMNTWLKDNGFRTLPEKANPIMNDYIEKNWCFVAAKLIRDNEGTSTPHPILIKFKADKPVYPMRLTALSGSTLYLELFVLADREAIPKNYKLRKEYCNIFQSSFFDPKKDNSAPDGSWRKRGIARIIKAHKRFVAVEKFDRERGVWGADEIAHPDAEKVMWDECVLTKLAGKVKSRNMNADMVFRFKNPTIFRPQIFSIEEAIKRGLFYAVIVLNAGLLIMLFLFKRQYTIKSNSDETVVNKEKILVHFLVLLFISIIVLAGTYICVGKKVSVEKFSSASYEWRNFYNNTLNSVFSGLRYNEKCTDAEIMEEIKNQEKRGYYNPFTKGPVIIEDSPGNITIVREYGDITAFTSHWRDGTPVLLFDVIKSEKLNIR